MSEWNWYECTGRYEAEGEAAEKKTGKQSPRKKGWTRARVMGVLVLVLAMIAGTSLAFSAPKDNIVVSMWGGDGQPEDLPEDWKDFFEDYYSAVNEPIQQSNIPKTELEGGFVLELQSGEGEEMSLQQLYAVCADSIAAIYGYEDGKEGYYWGTGVVLSEDGLILTNAHVIAACDKATVLLSDDKEYEAELIGSDTISDIALLKIDAEGLQPAVFGESAQLQVGEKVAAIGNPLSESFRSTLTDGIISAIERGISMNGHSMTLLQTNAAINEGNSGGALFNMYGQVIGITNMKMTSAYSSVEGMGFAIPSATVRTVVNSLAQYGIVKGRPSLGLVIGSIPEYAAEHYELPEGLYVTEVKEKSDAARQGMQAGDVIVEVNYEKAESADQVNAMKNTLEVGDVMMFKVWRDGEYLEFEVMLMETNDIY